MRQKENPEYPDANEAYRLLIESLATKGSTDPESERLLEQWTINAEREASEANTPRASIELNLKRAELYLAAGYRDEAQENFEAAQIQAIQENETALLETIEKRMAEMEGGGAE